MKAIFEGKILTVPNLLSFLRLCMVPLFLWIYLGLDEPLWAAGLLVLSGITDTVDGWIARKFHQVSNLGKALDPFADKVTQIAVVTCLSIRFPRLWIVSGVLLAKESFALITSLMAIHSSGEIQGADWHGKVTTTLMYITMIAHLVFPEIPDIVSITLTILCTGMILLSGVLYGIRNIHSICAGKVEEVTEL
jgi:cardiolipin synthase